MGQILFAPAGAGVASDDVTATKAQVLSGYTALTSDSDDEAASGSMTNNGAWTSSSSGSGKITIPAGYHNGSGYVDCSGAYNKGVTDADNRTNSNSANYKAGYNAGITAADARVNTSSASYNNGYNAGITAADARVNTSSASYNNGYNSGYTNGQSHPHTYVFDNGQSVAGHVPNYQSLSAANFAIYSFSATAQASFNVIRDNANSVRDDGLCRGPVSGGSGAISYNASTGVASVSAPNGSAHADAGGIYGSSTLYLSSSCRLICFY